MLVLYGVSGSGKSTIAKHLVDHYDYRKAISCTSRPKRKGEIDGIDYYFKTEDEMFNLFFLRGDNIVFNDKLIDFVKYGNNYYGLSISEFEKSNLAIMEPEGIRIYLASNFDICPIYIACDNDVLENRIFTDKHRDQESSKNRLNIDKEVFDDDAISLAHGRIITNNGNISKCAREVNDLYCKYLRDKELD